MHRTLFWDFDGTVAERAGMWTGTFISILERNGYCGIKKEDIRPFLNYGFPWHSPATPHSSFLGAHTWWEYHEKYFSTIFARFGISDENRLSLASQVRQEYLNPSQWTVFPDVRPTLTSLSQSGCRHFICSNHVPELEDLMVALGVRDLFEDVFTSGKIGYEKPNPKFFEHVLVSTKSDPKDCVMIGDSYEADVAGALLANIAPILVRSPNSKDFRWYAADFQRLLDVLKLLP
jgi:putative hydrolase of the HAD superfamily